MTMPRHDAPERATYADIEAAPPNTVAELIDGVLHTQPRPAPRHAIASSYLGDELVSPYAKGRGGPGGWWILDEPELHLGGDVLVPDLAGWRKERMPAMPDTAYFTVVPDWVCEVISPSTQRKDLFAKRPLYAEYGVAHLWLVDPAARSLEAFELRDGHWTLIAALTDDASVSVAPFDAIAFPLDALWPD